MVASSESLFLKRNVKTLKKIWPNWWLCRHECKRLSKSIFACCYRYAHRIQIAICFCTLYCTQYRSADQGLAPYPERGALPVVAAYGPKPGRLPYHIRQGLLVHARRLAWERDAAAAWRHGIEYWLALCFVCFPVSELTLDFGVVLYADTSTKKEWACYTGCYSCCIEIALLQDTYCVFDWSFRF